MEDIQINTTEKIYAEVLDWYKTADNKAQIILGLLSTFVVFFSGIIVMKPDDIQKTIILFDCKIWLFFIISILGILYGVFAAFKCLESRLNVTLKINEIPSQIYEDEQMYFFGYHASHKPDSLYNSLITIDKDRHLKIYSYQIIALSKNVVKKHRWINRAFIAVSMSVFFLLIATVLYLIKL